MIDWNGVKYASLAAFRTATGQESRGVQADPAVRATRPAPTSTCSPGSPAIDSANTAIASASPHSTSTAATAFDDPATVDTGIGPITYADRGAFEYRP